MRILALVLVLISPQAALAIDELWDLLRHGGQVVLIRHTITAPGFGDPPGMRLEDCSTQRNLSEEGRDPGAHPHPGKPGRAGGADAAGRGALRPGRPLHSGLMNAKLAWLFFVPLVSLSHAQSWSTRAPLPEARTEVSVTTDGRLVYLIAGYAQGLAMPRAMQVYDPATDRWSSPTMIPEGLNHTAAVHLAGKLYLVGGWRGANRDPTGALRIYDIASGRWSDGAPMPTPRAAHTAVVLEAKIHALGGSPDHATHEVYDPAQNARTRRAPMPTGRNHLAAAVLDGRIHVVGGRVGGDFTMTTHEIYDPAKDAWSAGPPLPTGRSGIAAVALDGKLYVFGGETFGLRSKTFNEAERYDPRSNRWQAMPPMPTARHGLGTAALGGAIHVLAGGPQPGATYATTHEVLRP